MQETSPLYPSPLNASDVVTLPPVNTSADIAKTNEPAALPHDSNLPPRPQNTRYLSFDFWRGVACLMLLLHHASFYADRSWDAGERSLGGLGVRIVGYLWMGVPMFFVVSGYCIAASIDSLRRKPHSIGNYFVRRFRRIYPPLWAALVIAVGLSYALQWNPALREHCKHLIRPADLTTWQWIGNTLAMESWLPLATGAEKSTYVMPNTWTLCYEEQFYALTGLILLLSARRFFGAAVLVTVLTLAARHLCRSKNINIDGLFFDGHWLLFAAGVFVYQYLHYAGLKLRLFTAFTFFAGIAYALLDRRSQTQYAERHLDEYILVSCAFALLLIALWRWDKAISQAWLLKPIAWCGKISYSIYLTHYPIVIIIACLFSMYGYHDDRSVMLLVLPISLVASLPIAWGFYQLVERRFQNAAQA